MPKLALHSGFAAAWPRLRELVDRREVVLIGSGVARLDVVAEAVAAARTAGLAPPSPLLDSVPGRTRAWPMWEVSTAPADRRAELMGQGWRVIVLSDDPSILADLTHHGLRIVGSAAMRSEAPEAAPG